MSQDDKRKYPVGLTPGGEPGGIHWPRLELPGVKIVVEASDKDEWAWVASAAGIVTSGRSLPEALRALAEAIEVTEAVNERRGYPPAWWRWFDRPAFDPPDYTRPSTSTAIPEQEDPLPAQANPKYRETWEDG